MDECSWRQYIDGYVNQSQELLGAGSRASSTPMPSWQRLSSQEGCEEALRFLAYDVANPSCWDALALRIEADCSRGQGQALAGHFAALGVPAPRRVLHCCQLERRPLRVMPADVARNFPVCSGILRNSVRRRTALAGTRCPMNSWRISRCVSATRAGLAASLAV